MDSLVFRLSCCDCKFVIILLGCLYQFQAFQISHPHIVGHFFGETINGTIFHEPKFPNKVTWRTIFASGWTACTAVFRPSDRVCGCGTTQFGETRTITHNLRIFVKSCTIRKCLLEISIKTGILSIKISRIFLD